MELKLNSLWYYNPWLTISIDPSLGALVEGKMPPML
jgi:hypothetical protein